MTSGKLAFFFFFFLFFLCYIYSVYDLAATRQGKKNALHFFSTKRKIWNVFTGYFQGNFPFILNSKISETQNQHPVHIVINFQMVKEPHYYPCGQWMMNVRVQKGRIHVKIPKLGILPVGCGLGWWELEGRQMFYSCERQAPCTASDMLVFWYACSPELYGKSKRK